MISKSSCIQVITVRFQCTLNNSPLHHFLSETTSVLALNRSHHPHPHSAGTPPVSSGTAALERVCADVHSPLCCAALWPAAGSLPVAAGLQSVAYPEHPASINLQQRAF